MIAFESVEKVYGARKGQFAVPALAEIDLVVPRGSITGVIGRSGAGKSTLIRLVNGLERPTNGKVSVDGVVVSELDEPQLRQQRRAIGMIFQHFNLLARRTAFDNIALPLEIAGVPASEIKARVAPLLDLVGLSDKSGRYPAELSGGQKQRVGIARALATKPKVLLSDEATSALDPETTEQILALLRQINAEFDLTVLLITHEMAVITAVADRVAVIDEGRIIETGATFEVFTNPQHPTTVNFVSSVTGLTLPPDLTASLSPEPKSGGQAVLRLVFTGPHATEPLISRLSRSLGIDIGIVQGKIDQIGGQPFGVMVVTVPSERETVNAVIAAARGLDLGAEVLGYVS